MTPFPGVIILLLFYLSYLMGFTAGGQEAWFMKYATAIIYINVILLLVYYKKWNLDAVLYMAAVVFFGFAFEMVAAKTNMLYGDYSFGPSMGPKVAAVPYAIGFYWLMMTMSTGIATAKIKIHAPILRTITAAGLQTALALLIFQLADNIKLWDIAMHQTAQIRYAAVYFGFALLLQYVFTRMKLDSSNRIAPYVYLLLWVFFGGLFMFMR